MRAAGVRPEGAEPPASREAGTPKGAQPLGMWVWWVGKNKKQGSCKQAGWLALRSIVGDGDETKHKSQQ